MQEFNRVFGIIKLYVQKTHSKGFVSFDSLSSEAGITRTVLKEHLEELKKMKMITYSATGACYLLLTKQGMETNSIISKPEKVKK